MLPSRIPQSALHVYKERTDTLDLRGQNSCSIYSGVGSKHI